MDSDGSDSKISKGFRGSFTESGLDLDVLRTEAFLRKGMDMDKTKGNQRGNLPTTGVYRNARNLQLRHGNHETHKGV